MGTFVLVHGGAHGSWCWEKIMAPLRNGGHEVMTVDLPRQAPGGGPVSMEDWVDTLGAVVDRAAAPPVLVAHSMGGLTASVLAGRRPDALRGLVYVSAVVPADGQDGLTALGAAGAESVLLEPGALVPTEDGTQLVSSEDSARRAFYSGCSEPDIEAALPRLVPEAIAPMATPLSLGEAFLDVPKVYIGATADRAVPTNIQRPMAEAARARFVAMDADHSPFLSAPDQLVDLLLQAEAQLA